MAIGPEMDPSHTMAIAFTVFSNRGVAEEKNQDPQTKRRAAPLAGNRAPGPGSPRGRRDDITG